MQAKPTAHYFVDESGDGVLFGARGKSMLTQAALQVSRHFILGALQVRQPQVLAEDLNTLRLEILQDPYFRNIPSLKPEKGKTARFFHAKDDVPEVRREVFRRLQAHDIRFYAVVRDMQAVLLTELERRRIEPTHRYRPDTLYDSGVALLFKDRLAQATHCHICFAQRGKANRTRALQAALDDARQKLELENPGICTEPADVVAKSSAEEPLLQAADYLVWALQRHYRSGESRFIEAMWDKVSQIHVVDDLQDSPSGSFYTKKKPLPGLQVAAL